MDSIIIREIACEDDPAIAQVIRDVLIEHNVPKVGTAYADPQLDCMFNTYDVPRAVYYIVERDGKVIGGAGIAKLANQNDNICELQKMYFLPQARGLGIGRRMMQKCLDAAVEFGYDSCYLETMPYMEDAQKLYRKSGFDYISCPIGDTGHSACPIYMLKPLK